MTGRDDIVPGTSGTSEEKTDEKAAPTRVEGDVPKSKPQRPVASLPQPSLPKGGGALAPIGEKFVAHPQTGTASLSIPIATSPGRSGFGPSLALDYDSGAGNGPYGIGWSVGMPSIGRRTDKGLPRYADEEESDVFVLSGAEDLVPVEHLVEGTERVVRYRPRVDTLFARIERRIQPGGFSYWVSYTRDNQRSVYGLRAGARLVDPDHPTRVFRWLLDWSDDDRGNVISYEYKAEDDTALTSMDFLYEADHRCTNVYPKAIGYANQTMRSDRALPPATVASGDFGVVVLFDYGEHHATQPDFSEVQPWPFRRDAFSSYRSGFDIRTRRRCQRILTLHLFGTAPEVVWCTQLGYDADDTRVSYLTTVERQGWKRRSDGSYDTKAFPATQLGYSRADQPDTTVQHAIDGAVAVDEGLGSAWQFVDYHGDGAPGLLTEQGGDWWYQRPLYGERLAPPNRIVRKPDARLADGLQLQDWNGDGFVDAVQLGGSTPGVWERNAKGEWLPKRNFQSLPNIDFSDPSLRFADLDGDGFPDVVISDKEVVRWRPAIARSGLRDGFGDERTAPLSSDKELPFFRTRHEAVLLADMTGDGLPDVVHIRNSNVAYWPNLGYGRFGRRVQMQGSPWLDAPNRFMSSNVQLADLDGTGTADLVYRHADGVHIYPNLGGNRFGAKIRLGFLGPCEIQVHDLFGRGTPAVVWSSTEFRDRGRALRVAQLFDVKPHLLTSIDNRSGAVTNITYATSTDFAILDRTVGKPWATKLPFPVHVVKRVVQEDLVAQTKLTTVYRYHHGFYDGQEREFRGFAYVEQEDTEDIGHFAGQGGYPGGLDETLHIPPTLTKTWYATGVFTDADRVAKQITAAYCAGLPGVPDSVLPQSMRPEEQRQACRALRGRQLRQEVYALDGNPKPYSVTESNFTVKLERAQGDGRYAVFSIHPRETLTVHAERQPSNPRIQHAMVLRTSAYGDVTDEVMLAYARQSPAIPAQGRTVVGYTWRAFADLTAVAGAWRLGVPLTEEHFELTGVDGPGVRVFGEVLGLLGLDGVSSAPTTRAYDPRRRPLDLGAPELLGLVPVGAVRNLYWSDDAATVLPWQTVEPRALPAESLVQSLTDAVVAELAPRSTQGELAQAALESSQSGYRFVDGSYWAPSSRLTYDKDQFFLPTESRDPFGGIARVVWESPAYLLPLSVTDPVDNTTTFANDYRVLQPSSSLDPNGTTTTVTIDTLGVVIATAVTSGAGATLEGGQITEVDYAFYGPGAPAWVRTHAFPDYRLGSPPATQETTVLYADGSGREAMRKVLVAPGLVDGVVSNPRYAGTGRTVFNNKGLPVKKYEPYFSISDAYETEDALVTRGVTPVLHYDPLGRLIRVDQPNGTFTEVRPDAWTVESWDENDTLTVDIPWYQIRSAGTLGSREQRAATEAILLAGTPKREHIDPLGRKVHTEHLLVPAGPPLITRVDLDLAGNVLRVTDPRLIQVAEHCFDLAGRRIVLESPDAGPTLTLPDAAGKPQIVFRGLPSDTPLRLRHEYDAAQRPTQIWVTDDRAPTEMLREMIVYGESASPTDRARGRVALELDGAGLVAHAYDFRGQAAHSARRVVQIDATTTTDPDWTPFASLTAPLPLPPALDALLEAPLTTDTTYDALGRAIVENAPDTSVVLRTYNEAGQLLSVAARGDTLISEITYDEKGRRSTLTHQGNVTSIYTYDPLTFRLIRILTTKALTGGGQTVIQDLAYVYDAVGNIASILDSAQPTLYFQNGLVPPEMKYTYDGLYRLITSEGREHAGQATPDQRQVVTPFALPASAPNDLQAITTYRDTYAYDDSGNITLYQHQQTGPLGASWHRDYTYEATSNRLVEATLTDNTGSALSTYPHDARGNMMSLPHLPRMSWTHRDQLRLALRTQVGSGPFAAHEVPTGSNPVFMHYDARGQRVRKRSLSGQVFRDCLYVGSFEVSRESKPSTPLLVRTTLHLSDGEQRFALLEHRAEGTDDYLADVTRFQHTNHLSSACIELDADGTPLSYEEFHAYGTTALHGLKESTPPKRYRFTGMERDQETGLQSHGVRCYVPWLGRWASADPKEVPNRFQYARANPARYSDTNGRDYWDRVKDVSGQGGISDQQILALTTIPHFEDTLRGVLVAGYEQHLRTTDAAHQEHLKQPSTTDAERFWVGQPPLFPKGQEYTPGRSMVGFFNGVLLLRQREMADPVHRVREMLYQYYRHTSGLLEKQQALAYALVGAVSSFAALSFAARPRLAGGLRFPSDPNKLFPENYPGLTKTIGPSGKIAFEVEAGPGESKYLVEYHPEHASKPGDHYPGPHYHVKKQAQAPTPPKTTPNWFRMPNLDPNTTAVPGGGTFAPGDLLPTRNK